MTEDYSAQTIEGNDSDDGIDASAKISEQAAVLKENNEKLETTNAELKKVNTDISKTNQDLEIAKSDLEKKIKELTNAEQLISKRETEEKDRLTRYHTLRTKLENEFKNYLKQPHITSLLVPRDDTNGCLYVAAPLKNVSRAFLIKDDEYEVRCVPVLSNKSVMKIDTNARLCLGGLVVLAETEEGARKVDDENYKIHPYTAFRSNQLGVTGNGSGETQQI